jgi:outer membrane protein OmpA-like peptidoglycan-associated protein
MGRAAIFLSSLCAAAAAATAAAQAPSPPASEQADAFPCEGGRLVFFAQGSDRLDPYGAELIAGLAAYARRDGLMRVARLRIESGGDGFGAAFDRALSRRRSAAIRELLVAQGLAAGQIEIGEPEDALDEVPTADPDLQRRSWVALRIPIEVHRRRYPPGIVVECF